jgi:site-specific DNA-methyltransferase (adenine-specific)/adenine-specific DNA-methyltransferase
MNDRFREVVIETLRRGEELPAEWARELFPPERREYELVYHGKERAEEILADTMGVPLQPVRTFGKNGDWHNMLIFGDNLQAMKSLLQMKERGELQNADGSVGVRVAYIDPPFATMQEFRGSGDEQAYQDKIAGARFLEFLRKRLVLLRELLHEHGTIYVHLDTRKSHYIKVLMDEVFGESRFLNEIVWRRSTSHASAERYGSVHDTLLVYSKTEKRVWNPQLEPLDDEYIDRYFRYDDGDGRRYWLEDATGAGPGPARRFGKKLIEPPKGRHYRWMQAKIDEYWKQNRFYITPGGRVQFKRYLDDQKGKAIGDVWSDIKRMNQVAGERVNYPTQKPEALLERVIAASSDRGDLVLDAFAGSGTTIAVAEKLGRRWIAIDCGKLAVYAMQKRLLHLKTDIGNTGKPLRPHAFTLYNAGLYDFGTLRNLPWEDWRFFALQLFGCRDEPHTVGRLRVDGKLKGSSVLVFNHHQHKGQRIDEDTVKDIHIAVGKQVGKRFFIIAPRGVFDFQQDYLDFDGVRYYALRIPYSIINELHARAFSALRQPKDESAINDTVDAVGFDFIRPPEVTWTASRAKNVRGQATLREEAILKLKAFQTTTRVRGEDVAAGMYAFAMLMLDLDYDGDVFDMDDFLLAQDLKDASWEVRLPIDVIGRQVMAVFTDIYGNESRVVIPREQFGLPKQKVARKHASAKPNHVALT